MRSIPVVLGASIAAFGILVACGSDGGGSASPAAADGGGTGSEAGANGDVQGEMGETGECCGAWRIPEDCSFGVSALAVTGDVLVAAGSAGRSCDLGAAGRLEVPRGDASASSGAAGYVLGLRLPSLTPIWVVPLVQEGKTANIDAVATDPNGDVVVSGFFRDPSSPAGPAGYPSGVLARITADGRELWKQTLAPTASTFPPLAIAVAPNGDLFTARVEEAVTRIARRDRAGNQVWEIPVPGGPRAADRNWLATSGSGDAVLAEAFVPHSQTGLLPRPPARIVRIAAADGAIAASANAPGIPRGWVALEGDRFVSAVFSSTSLYAYVMFRPDGTEAARGTSQAMSLQSIHEVLLAPDGRAALACTDNLRCWRHEEGQRQTFTNPFGFLGIRLIDGILRASPDNRGQVLVMDGRGRAFVSGRFADLAACGAGGAGSAIVCGRPMGR